MTDKPRKRKRTRPPAIRPKELQRLGKVAAEKHYKRGAFVPDLELKRDGSWGSPYEGKLEGHWWALFFDMLGTRQAAFVDAFFYTLSDLLGPTWDSELGQNVTDIPAMRAALAQVNAMKVENEAQAAYAAMLVALQLNTMKLAKGTMRFVGGDARSIAIMAKATRAYGDGLLNLKRLQGTLKPTESSQTYKVERHVHNHHHQHVHLAGGGAENGGQPHAKPTAGVVEAIATLPSPDSTRDGMPIACDAERALPLARGQKSRSAKG